jgi:hypothetical protein
MDKVNEVAGNLQEAMKNPDQPVNKAVIDKYKVNAQEEGQKQSSYAIDVSRVDWSQLEHFGVTRETLERTKSLEAMLNWQKSPVLIPITTRFDDVTLRTDARLSFRETPDGRLVLSVHAIRKEPELNRPYYGIKFTDEDKHNLLTTGNLGRIVDADFKQGEKTPVFVSLDKLTNELIALRTDKIQIPENIKGVTLNEAQKKELSEGKEILIENMTSKNGNEFSAHVQINADKKSIEFHFDQKEKQNEQKQSQAQNREVHIPKTLLGVELSEKQQSKLQEGQTIYVSGMKDEKGQEFNAYVQVNNEKNKVGFLQMESR